MSVECVAAGGRGRHTGLFLSERSLWRPKTCLCQIYMIFDRHRVGVINLNSDRNVTVIRTIVTVCLLRLHQTLYLSGRASFYLPWNGIAFSSAIPMCRRGKNIIYLLYLMFAPVFLIDVCTDVVTFQYFLIYRAVVRS